MGDEIKIIRNKTGYVGRFDVGVRTFQLRPVGMIPEVIKLLPKWWLRQRYYVY